ncbi:MAG: DUF4293 domain-containing protein [Bacteroidales bacterium]|nr:DUF4293 domain-containing protein [Bacteroidales bacterium]
MIQRIQSVYWFLAAVAACMMLPFEWMQLIVTDGDYEFAASGINRISGTEIQNVISGIPLITYIAAFAVFNIVIIFLYKNRMLQARLSTIAIILALGLYGVIAFYRYMSFNAEVVASSFNWPLLLPLVSLVCDFWAQRGAVKDEMKVRSLDRIR